MNPLRQFRRRCDIGIEKLATLLGTSPATISRIENGLQDPQPAMMRKIAAISNGEITPNDLLGIYPNGSKSADTEPRAEATN